MNSKTAKQQKKEPRLLARGWDRLQGWIENDQKKWGGMTFSAMWRLGWAELREAFSFGGNVAQPTPYGMFGTSTPGEVGTARETKGKKSRDEMEEEPVMASKNRLPSPAQIAAGQGRSVQGQEQERVQGQDQRLMQGEREKNPSPSQIAANPEPRAPEQQHSQEHEHGMEH